MTSRRPWPPAPRLLAWLPFAFLVVVAADLLGPAAAPAADLPCDGRWDATLSVGDRHWPAWFEISGPAAIPTVLFQAPAGAPQRIREVAYRDGRLAFVSAAIGAVECRFDGERIAGVAVSGRDSILLGAVRVPELPEMPVAWGTPERLFDGRSLDGWTYRWNRDSSWVVRDGALASALQIDDLVSAGRWMNFKLHLQYRLQEFQDSGVQLRGRYEIQLTDRKDAAGPTGNTGAVYGYFPPLANAQRPAGKWNTLDVELVGARLTARLNGRLIQDRVRLPGITGDALDSDEGQPGPIMLQGHLGAAQFRDIVVTPAR